MKFGVAPPEYFPGIEFAALALSVDVLVVADTFRYARQTRQNRARLRTPTGSQWMTIPVTGGQFGRSISAMEIDPASHWRRIHPKSIRFNYGGAAFYEHYVDDLTRLIVTSGDRLPDVTVQSTRWVLDALSVGTRVMLASEMQGVPRRFESIRGLWPAMTAVGSRAQLDRVGHLCPGDAVVEVEPFRYRQAFPGFEAGLSVLDLLMNHGPRAADMIRNETRLKPVAVASLSP